MATLEKRGVVGILCTLGDKILPPEVPAIAYIACTTEFWTIEAVVGTWADTNGRDVQDVPLPTSAPDVEVSRQPKLFRGRGATNLEH